MNTKRVTARRQTRSLPPVHDVRPPSPAAPPRKDVKVIRINAKDVSVIYK